MYPELFLKGLAAGLVIAAPVGPVGVLCVHRTLVRGRLHGLVSGLGAALADASFGALAASGVTFVADFLTTHQSWLRLGGGVLLVALGARTLLAPPDQPGGEDRAAGWLGDALSAFVLTVTNPITILSFLAVFAALGVAIARAGPAAAGTLVAGVFTGSSLWWFALSAGVGLFRRTLEAIYLRWIHHLSGGLLVVFGIGVLATLVL